MQALAPLFTEIDENIEYKEREDEFETSTSDENANLQIPNYISEQGGAQLKAA